MSSIVEYFKTLTTLPRCSYEADAFVDFFIKFSSSRGYETQVDKAKNILITKGAPRLCLQAHYDMVCMGKAPVISVYEEDGWLKAKDSSLGADNGMAIAMMMELIDSGRELEFLLTSDEEVGLIGASSVAFKLQSTLVLNLDSEDEGEVYIGCAGGLDITASKPYATVADQRDCYEVSILGLPGGHSGVDIDKDIPNAIKLLTYYLKDLDFGLVSIEGGERSNSIPTQCKAVIRCATPPPLSEKVTIAKIQSDAPILYGGNEIVVLLANAIHGVRELNRQFEIPQRSANLAMVATKNGLCTIHTSTRAMSMDDLQVNRKEVAGLFEGYGYDTRQSEKYPSWSPEINEFTQLVDSAMREIFGHSELKAIHAGLECGVLSQKYPHVKIASIGPTIKFPHSMREMVNIDSVDKTFEVLLKVIQRVS